MVIPQLCFEFVFVAFVTRRWPVRMASQKLSKFGPQGHYKHFPGVTVVLPVINAQDWAQPVLDLINGSILSKYYSALPVSSYHMTLIDLFSQRSVGTEHRFCICHSMAQPVRFH